MTYRTEDERALLLAFLQWSEKQPYSASQSHEEIVARFLAWREAARGLGKE